MQMLYVVVGMYSWDSQHRRCCKTTFLHTMDARGPWIALENERQSSKFTDKISVHARYHNSFIL